MKIRIISQTDSRWSSVKLGSSNSTIGGSGCLVCAISMLLGKKTPIELNNDKSNFASGNLWIWASINKYGGKYNGRYNYSKTKLDELVNKYGAVVVAVNNFNHYVVYTKWGKIYNPAGGKIVDSFGSYVPCALYDQVPNSDGYIENNSNKYNIGTTYTTTVILKVRQEAGTNARVKLYSELTENAKANAYSEGINIGCLKQGTKVTCLETKTINNEIWLRIPSGWVAGFYNNQEYIK